MQLTSIQNSAIALLENHLGDQSQASFAGNESHQDDSTALAAIQTYQKRTSQNQTLRVGAAKGELQGAFSDDLISSLPILMTPEVKKNLRTLEGFAKLGNNATMEQKEEAKEAYRAIGKSINVMIAEKAIYYGISVGLKEVPYIGSFSGAIAAIASHPLAEMAASHGSSHIGLQHQLINLALKALGKEPISIEDHDLFMAKAVGMFADGIIKHAEKNAAKGFSDRTRTETPVVNTIG